MSFVPENPLEEAIVRANKSAMTRREFYRLLLESDLVVIGRIEGRDPLSDRATLAPGEKLQIASATHEGRKFVPVFSSMTRLEAHLQKTAEYVTLNGRALFEITRGSAFLLNPGSEFGKELSAEEISSLLDPPDIAAQRIVIGKPMQVLIGQPAVYPHALVDALKQAFAARPDVLAAYLVQIGFADQPSHPLIGVETIGEWAALSAEIGPCLDGGSGCR